MQIHAAACQHANVPSTKPRRSLSAGITGAARSFLTERSYDGSPKTVASYTSQLAPFLAYCEAAGAATFAAVTPDLIRAYLRHEQDSTRPRRRGSAAESPPARISRTTLQMRYTVLAVFLKWCLTEGKVKANPMANVAKPKGERRIRHAFTQEECKALLAAAREAPGILAYRDPAIVTLLVDTGARASELANLRWSDVHWGADGERGLGHIEVYGKGRKMRRLTLGTTARRALRRWGEVAPRIEGDWVWVTIRRQQLTADSMLDMLHRLGEYAGIANVHTHRFRHTFATEYTRQNRDVYATKARLGHEKIATTEVYLHSLGIDYGSDAAYKTPGEWLK